MWEALWSFIKSAWHGRPERIEPVIQGYTGVMGEWRLLYNELKQALEDVKAELEECREDRQTLHKRIDEVEQRTAS